MRTPPALTARQVARALAWARIGIGLSAIVAPGLPARPWVGRGDPRAVKTLGRALGGRDIALGLGVLRADATERSSRDWLAAGAAGGGRPRPPAGPEFREPPPRRSS